jgi:L-ascorbate metabolism protein UlaG (beta-lactamase superfamily)
MKKYAIIITSVLFISLLGMFCLGGCALREFGQTPRDTAAFEDLPHFSDGQFQSPEETPFYRDRVSGGNFGWLRHVLHNRNAPKNRLPMHRLTKDSFAEKPEDLTVYWLGHASLILELEGKRFLVDPVFGNAAPVPLAVRRYSPAPLRRRDVPRIDYVLITHDHYDHLEYVTMRQLRNRDVIFIAPLGVGEHLIKWGISPEKIRELDWGDEFTEDGVTVIAESVRHFSGRTYGSRNSSLWAGYVVKGQQHRVYISGDTGYGEHFRATGEKHGPFDMVFLEIDAWNPGWPNTHLFPDEVIQTYHDLRAKALVPVHWGVFDLALHPWDESIRALSELVDKDDNVVMFTPLMGQKLVPGVTQTSRWWEGLR